MRRVASNVLHALATPVVIHGDDRVGGLRAKRPVASLALDSGPSKRHGALRSLFRRKKRKEKEKEKRKKKNKRREDEAKRWKRVTSLPPGRVRSQGDVTRWRADIGKAVREVAKPIAVATVTKSLLRDCLPRHPPSRDRGAGPAFLSRLPER
jgi:hypothetical protein